VSDDLQAKEEEYLRLNAEIEEKTKNLVREVSGFSNDDLEGDTSRQLHSRLSQLNLSYEGPASPVVPHQAPVHQGSLSPPIVQSSYITDMMARAEEAEEAPRPRPVSRHTPAPPSAPPTTDEVMPEEGRHLGPEAAQRFLKAKVRVLQEEVEALTTQTMSQKVELSKLRESCKNSAEEKVKTQRNLESLHAQLEKYTHMVDSAKSKNKTLETELLNLRKDVEMRDRSEKKSSQTQKTVEVRLNRALEDVEKYKGLLAAARSQVSETNNQDKQTVGAMQAENRTLQKQKGELISAYKKQLKLIDVLRRQKLHLEASRMLGFTQEEFMKVLDWKNSA